MKIDVLYFEGCPNHKSTVQRVKQVIDRLGVAADVREVELTQDDDPAAMKFLGSPTVLIDGQDIDPGQRAGASYGFGCRTFGGPGIPSVKMIENAIQSVRQRATSNGIAERAKWLSSLGVLPGIGATLWPAGLCPACWPAYAGVLSALGLGFLLKTTYLLPVTALFLLVAVAALAFRAGSRRGYGPFALGLVAAAVVLIGKFIFFSEAAMYGGIGLLVAASVWNAWPQRATGENDGACSAGAPTERGSVQPSGANEVSQ